MLSGGQERRRRMSWTARLWWIALGLAFVVLVELVGRLV
jgi:hypothetical protein